LRLVVSNPPYVAESEVRDLPEAVVDWEPRLALVSGATGLEAIEEIVAEAPAWLDPAGGALVLELAPRLAATASGIATAVGFAAVTIHQDLAGRDRVLVARVVGPG
jgi:release factor glutamine methyltransferase